MRLSIYHRTHYRYRAPVRDSHNEVRLRPATDDLSRLEFFLLNVSPPIRLKHFRDPWMNYVHWFDINEPHMELSIESQVTLHTTSPFLQGKPYGASFQSLAEMQDDFLSPLTKRSTYVDINREIWKEAIDIKGSSDDVFATAEAIMSYIFLNWKYEPGSTSASTHMQEVLQTRCGVCQDFAHVMSGFCRSLGIPTRYVSGYLYNGEKDTLRGAQASHAWCEVYVPKMGWFGLDPTNNTPADERHAKIATGRDYADAAPITGSFDGPPQATQSLQIELQITQTGD